MYILLSRLSHIVGAALAEQKLHYRTHQLLTLRMVDDALEWKTESQCAVIPRPGYACSAAIFGIAHNGVRTICGAQNIGRIDRIVLLADLLIKSHVALDFCQGGSCCDPATACGCTASIFIMQHFAHECSVGIIALGSMPRIGGDVTARQEYTTTAARLWEEHEIRIPPGRIRVILYVACRESNLQPHIR